jgi:hypothetical protein
VSCSPRASARTGPPGSGHTATSASSRSGRWRPTCSARRSASARDAAALAAAAVSGQLLSAESAGEMLVPYAQCGPGTWQGLGVQIEYRGPVRLAGHGGTFPGFDAAVFACPETGESAALLANTNTGLLRDQLRTSLLAGSPFRTPLAAIRDPLTHCHLAAELTA